MKYKFSIIVFVIFSLLSNITFASEKNASKFVEQLSQQAVSIAASDKSSKAKELLLSELFVQNVDINWMARFALGRAWNEASQEQKSKYTEAYKKFLLQSYVPKFKEFNNQKIKIIDSVAMDENEFEVRTQIINDNGSATNVTYKVRLSNGKFAIYDVIAEGISLITTQRADFASILSRGGINDLTNKLNQKT